MEALAGYDLWRTTPPEAVEAQVRCDDCGECADYEDAARSGWIVREGHPCDEQVPGQCPVCQDEEQEDW